MKNKKLIANMFVLTLVLCLGACSTEQEKTSDEVGGDSTDSTSSEPTVLEPATNPAEFIDNACMAGNYTLQLIVDEWISQPILTTDAENENFDFDDLYEGMTRTEYIIFAYYTEDALMVEYCYMYSNYLILLEADLYINVTSGLKTNLVGYYSANETSWTYYNTWSGKTWQDYFYSLFDNPKYMQLTSSDFTYVSTGYDSYGDEYDTYSFASDYADMAFGFLTGADLWDYNTLGYAEVADYLYFYPEVQELYSAYWAWLWYYTDTTKEYVELYEEDFYSVFYDVGTTDISQYVDAALSQDILFIQTYPRQSPYFLGGYLFFAFAW